MITKCVYRPYFWGCWKSLHIPSVVITHWFKLFESWVSITYGPATSHANKAKYHTGLMHLVKISEALCHVNLVWDIPPHDKCRHAGDLFTCSFGSVIYSAWILTGRPRIELESAQDPSWVEKSRRNLVSHPGGIHRDYYTDIWAYCWSPQGYSLSFYLLLPDVQVVYTVTWIKWKGALALKVWLMDTWKILRNFKPGD